MNSTKFDLRIRFYIFLKIRKANLIKILKLSIFFSFFLYGVICKMNQFIVQVLQSILFARCTHITLLIPVPFDESIDTRYENIAAYIKFTLIV